MHARGSQWAIISAVPRCRRAQSARSVTIGSVRDARRAGTYPASAATIASMTARGAPKTCVYDVEFGRI